MFSKQESINFIIGLIFNQSYDSDMAWKAPMLLKDRLDPLNINLMDIERYGLNKLINAMCNPTNMYNSVMC